MSVKNNNQLNRFDLLHIKNKEPQTYEDVVYYVKKKKEPKKYLQLYKEQKDLMKNKDKKKISNFLALIPVNASKSTTLFAIILCL